MTNPEQNKKCIIMNGDNIHKEPEIFKYSGDGFYLTEYGIEKAKRLGATHFTVGYTAYELTKDFKEGKRVAAFGNALPIGFEEFIEMSQDAIDRNERLML